MSGAFVAIPAVNSNHLSHTGNELESGTLERKRPVSMTVMEGDLLKKDRYGSSQLGFQFRAHP